MSRLPSVGGDLNAWGQVLNEFLLISHNADGTLKTTAVNSVVGGSLSALGASLASAEGGTGALVPSPLRPTATLTATPTGKNPAWLSSDRTTIFNWSGTTSLQWSTDDGTTWTANPNAFPGGITAVRDTDDGEILVFAQSAGSIGQIYKSTGWTASHATATFTLVKQASSASVYFHNAWSLSVSGKYVVANEYGAKTAGANARYCYFSQDYGATWATIYDLGAGDGQQHLHGACFDPFWQRIWISHGDSTNHIYYSDDYGATWSGDVKYENAALKNQVTGIIALRDCVLFMSDSAPNGIHRARRVSKSTTPVLEQAFRFDANTTITHLSYLPFQAKASNAPVLISLGIDSGAGYSGPGRLLATLDGFAFHELWSDTIIYSGIGLYNMVGPTALGNIVGTLDDGRNATYSILKMAAPVWRPAEKARGVAMQTGIYYTPPGTGTTVSASNSKVWAIPLTVLNPVMIDAVGINVTVAGAPAGAVVRLGVYGDSNGYPGALVLDAGTSAADTTGVKEIALSPTLYLSPGVYWLTLAAQAATTTAPTVQATQNPGYLIGAETAAIIAAGSVAGVQKGGGAAGAFPATFPTGYAATTAAPRVYVHVLYAH